MTNVTRSLYLAYPWLRLFRYSVVYNVYITVVITRNVPVFENNIGQSKFHPFSQHVQSRKKIACASTRTQNGKFKNNETVRGMSKAWGLIQMSLVQLLLQEADGVSSCLFCGPKNASPVAHIGYILRSTDLLLHWLSLRIPRIQYKKNTLSFSKIVVVQFAVAPTIIPFQQRQSIGSNMRRHQRLLRNN